MMPPITTSATTIRTMTHASMTDLLSGAGGIVTGQSSSWASRPRPAPQFLADGQGLSSFTPDGDSVKAPSMALFPEVELVILVKGPVRGYLGWPVSPLRAI